jgi:hypothetical protein
MKAETTIPFAISDYITTRFRKDFLFEVKDIKRKKGHLYYTIEVSKDNYILTLQFNESGKLIKEETREAYASDEHDGPGFEDVPE